MHTNATQTRKKNKVLLLQEGERKMNNSRLLIFRKSPLAFPYTPVSFCSGSFLSGLSTTLARAPMTVDERHRLPWGSGIGASDPGGEGLDGRMATFEPPEDDAANCLAASHNFSSISWISDAGIAEIAETGAG
jgi:hypothetical protein